MSTPPERPLDAQGLARSGAVIERSYPIARFVRLRDRLADADGSASARAEFRQEGDVPAVLLRVSASVVLVCQRCLKPVRRAIESEAAIAFAPEDTPGLPPEIEPVGGDPRDVDLGSLVEDELLLALPVVAHHVAGERCELPSGADVAVASDARAEARRPFAGLKDLLKN